MKIQQIKKSTIVPALWQGGQTFEYLIYPTSTKYSERNFDIRISSATIESSASKFTQFKGYQRYLVMLDNTLHIVHNGQKEQYEVDDLFVFESDAEIESFSKGNDFNLMVRHGIEASVSIESQINREVTTQYMIVFALQKSTVEINQITYTLDETDCLWIEDTLLQTFSINVIGKVVWAYWT